MGTELWIEKGWGDSVDQATFKDILVAINETIEMDDEHGAFWVGNMENEYVLEVSKNLDLHFIFGEEPGEVIKTRLSNWEEVKAYYVLYLNNDYTGIKNKINERL